MPSPSERDERHRNSRILTKPRQLGRVIGATTILVLLAGTIFVGGWWLVWILISNDKSMSVVSPVPQKDFTPVNPAVPFSLENIDKECSDFFDRDDVQKYYIAQGGPKSDPDQLDLDNDGLACENYNYQSSSPATSKVNAK